jgi:molybdenum storage protein
VAELQARNLTTLPIDRIVLDLMSNAKLMKEIQVVNGLQSGNLTRALAGEPVGTTIFAD